MRIFSRLAVLFMGILVAVPSFAMVSDEIAENSERELSNTVIVRPKIKFVPEKNFFPAKLSSDSPVFYNMALSNAVEKAKKTQSFGQKTKKAFGFTSKADHFQTMMGKMAEVNSKYKLNEVTRSFYHANNTAGDKKYGELLTYRQELTFESPEKAAEAQKELEATGLFEYVEHEPLFYIHAAPNDSDYGSMGSMDYIRLPQARDLIDGLSDWPRTRVNVGIVDDGWVSHPDMPQATYYNRQTVNDNSHGTATSSNVTALTNNSQGMASGSNNNGYINLFIAGVARGGGSLLPSAGFGAVMANPIDVFNGSYGGMRSCPSAEAYLAYPQTIFVFSAGNHGTAAPASPGHCSTMASNVISSGAIDHRTGNRAGFSAHTWPDTYAPGSQVVVATTSNGYGRMSGTSFSSPITAGVATLLKSVNADLCGEDIKRILINTSDSVSGRRHINAESALQYVIDNPNEGSSNCSAEGGPGGGSSTATSTSSATSIATATSTGTSGWDDQCNFAQYVILSGSVTGEVTSVNGVFNLPNGPYAISTNVTDLLPEMTRLKDDLEALGYDARIQIERQEVGGVTVGTGRVKLDIALSLDGGSVQPELESIEDADGTQEFETFSGTPGDECDDDDNPPEDDPAPGVGQEISQRVTAMMISAETGSEGVANDFSDDPFIITNGNLRNSEGTFTDFVSDLDLGMSVDVVVDGENATISATYAEDSRVICTITDSADTHVITTPCVTPDSDGGGDDGGDEGNAIENTDFRVNVVNVGNATEITAGGSALIAIEVENATTEAMRELKVKLDLGNSTYVQQSVGPNTIFNNKLNEDGTYSPFMSVEHVNIFPPTTQTYRFEIEAPANIEPGQEFCIGFDDLAENTTAKIGSQKYFAVAGPPLCLSVAEPVPNMEATATVTGEAEINEDFSANVIIRNTGTQKLTSGSVLVQVPNYLRVKKAPSNAVETENGYDIAFEEFGTGKTKEYGFEFTLLSSVLSENTNTEGNVVISVPFTVNFAELDAETVSAELAYAKPDVDFLITPTLNGVPTVGGTFTVDLAVQNFGSTLSNVSFTVPVPENLSFASMGENASVSADGRRITFLKSNIGEGIIEIPILFQGDSAGVAVFDSVLASGVKFDGSNTIPVAGSVLFPLTVDVR